MTGKHLAALAILTLPFLSPPLLSAERKAVTIKSVDTQVYFINVEMDVEGRPGEMICTRSQPLCVAPPLGKYVIATDETGRYMDCVDDVGLFPEATHFSPDEKIGVYCLLSPDRTPNSCPVILNDLVNVDAAYPFVNMSVRNSTGKVVTAVEIGYASIDHIGFFTTAPQRIAISRAIEPNQNYLFSTVGNGEKILDHKGKSNGVGIMYFIDEVRFADGTQWSADPMEHTCGIMDEGAKRIFAPK